MADPIPCGMHSITPHIIVNGAAKAVEFYKKVFGAEQVGPVSTMPDGKVMHAHLKIGDSHLMMADEFPQGSCRSPQSLGGSPVVLTLYVTDVDATWKKATEAGAKVVFPLSNQFWGDRYGQVADPFGHVWALATHIEDLTQAEIEERAKSAFAHAGQ
ncbi:MAG: VOC family protein [Acidobacteriia bacterium]|nr:VOC family protein [Terriglobia bacterium]